MPEATLQLRYKWSDMLIQLDGETLYIKPVVVNTLGEEDFYYQTTASLGLVWSNVEWLLSVGVLDYAEVSSDNITVTAGTSARLVYENISLNLGYQHLLDERHRDLLGGFSAGVSLFNKEWMVQAELQSGDQWNTGSFQTGFMLSLSYRRANISSTIGTGYNHPLYANRRAANLSTVEPNLLNMSLLLTPFIPEPERQDPLKTGRNTLRITSDTTKEDITQALLEPTDHTYMEIITPFAELNKVKQACEDNPTACRQARVQVDFNGATVNSPNDLNTMKELIGAGVFITDLRNTDSLSPHIKYYIKNTPDFATIAGHISYTQQERHYRSILGNTGDQYPQLIKNTDGTYKLKYGSEDAEVLQLQNALILNNKLYSIKTVGLSGHGVTHDLEVEYLMDINNINIDPLGQIYTMLEHAKSTLTAIEALTKVSGPIQIDHESNEGFTGIIIKNAVAKTRGPRHHLNLRGLRRISAAALAEKTLTVTTHRDAGGPASKVGQSQVNIRMK